ncbi:NUDIX domain-containing protein [Geomicrobium sp. JSM 1781026]|uniref:NUDIX hydrolase n=1 Tax=Geomicrobium sp. JSM 1781026 TaxID=3344580 RepID=UPI0035BF775B
MEYIDVFDKQLQHQGVASRRDIHEQGLWHQTFHCWFTTMLNGEVYVLFQKRSPGKEDYPGFLDISAAGHLEAGESPKDGVREIKEELGLKLDFSELTSIGVLHVEAPLAGGRFDREHCHVYVKQLDPVERDNIQFDAEEVEGVEWISLQQCVDLFIDGNATSERFVPHPNEYYEKIVEALVKLS